VLLLASLWGASFPLLKVAVESFPPLTVAAGRAALGAALLVAALGPRRGLLIEVGARGDWFAAQAAFNCVIPWLLVTWASRRIDAGLTTILNSLSPLFIFLITWGITRHEPASPRKLAGIALGFTGVLFVAGPGALSGLGEQALAQAACVGGSIAYAIAAVIGRRYDGFPALVPAAGAALVGALVLVPLALVLDPWPTAPSLRSVLALLALGVFSTGAAFVVYFHLLASIGSIATASQAYLRIVIGVGLSAAFLGERPSPSTLAGLALVVAGVVFMTLPGRRRRDAQ